MGRIEADIALEKLAVCISALFGTVAVYPTYMIQANFQLVLAPKIILPDLWPVSTKMNRRPR